MKKKDSWENNDPGRPRWGKDTVHEHTFEYQRADGSTPLKFGRAGTLTARGRSVRVDSIRYASVTASILSTRKITSTA
jgi:hypothetical protein